MTPESKVKMAVKRLLEMHKVWYFLPVSNGMGRHGIPDVLCCVNSFFLAIECKAGKGKTTALQDREIEAIKSAGGSALVIRDNEEDFRTLDAVLTTLKNQNVT